MQQAHLVVGQLVRDGLGHWYRVVDAADRSCLRVQPLTPSGPRNELVPIGTPVWAYRSDLRADGE